MLPISAIIITLNEERRLARALESLSIADEIIVVDSGSTDCTTAIAARYGAKVISQAWQGYSRQKNFAASLAKYDWVLSLDADEALSPALQREIERIKREGPGDFAGFRMPRAAFYLRRWIRHSGWYPDYKLRLYDRRRGRWIGDYVHEHVQVDGAVGQLSGDLQHYTCDTLEEHLRTLDRYTTLAAQEAFDQRHRAVLAWMLLGPPWKFIETYLFRQGFRDGFQGLVIAVMAGFYVFLKYAKRWRMKKGTGNREQGTGNTNEQEQS
ncbi:MAG: glycosyltransferase family 2 protein [Acidobacteria bacterium]|nr:glycosyltransferase family 2 protein [Acidobacteriota bacterium]